MIDDRAGRVYVLDVVRGGPVDQRDSSITILDLNLQVLKRVEHLQPALKLMMSNRPSLVFLQEELTHNLKIWDMNSSKEVKSIMTTKCEDGSCILEDIGDYYLIGCNAEITVMDKKYYEVVARLKVAGSVKGMCCDKDLRFLYVQSGHSIVRYSLEPKCHEEVKKLEGIKHFKQSPWDENILFTVTQEGFVHKLSIKDDFKILQSKKCDLSVCRIAVNKTAKIAFVILGLAELYKFNLQTFEIQGELIDSMEGACQNIFIETVGAKEFLFLCGNKGIIRKYDIDTCELIDKIVDTEESFIGFAFCELFNCLVVGSQHGRVLFINADGFCDDFQINGKSVKSPYELKPVQGAIRSAAVSPDQRYIALGLQRGKIVVLLTSQVLLDLYHAEFDYHRDQVWEI